MLARTQHTVSAEVDYAARTVQVQQRVVYHNQSGQALNDLVFDVEPNRFDGAFVLDAVRIGDQPASSYEVTGRRLSVLLPERLDTGCTVTVALSFRLSIPTVEQGRRAGASGYFGYTDRQLNLGHWLPVVAWRLSDGWVTHDVLSIGEQTVTDVADWDVTLRLVNASQQAIIIAPGNETRLADGAQRFVHENARDFAASISDLFKMTSLVTQTGVSVEVFTLGDTLVNTERGSVSGADHVLDVATRSLDMYSDLFGAYPYSRLLVVQGDFPDGMEFSGMVFVGNGWFVNWTGGPQSYLTIITIHEVAHQWWYASVGSDQALTPWLDEALATYSEYIFYEEYYPDLRDWWWQFRVYSYVPAGFTEIEPVASTVYQFDNIRAYINAVYLRGAQMLHALREDLGTDAFFAWLDAYAESGRERVVTPDVLWGLLTAEQLALTEATRIGYLGTGAVSP
jgi:hypothetical protein